MTDFDDLARRYIDTWNETDPAARRRRVDDLWATDGTYVDPLAEARGRDAVDATIAAVQAQFPGFAFRLLGPVDAHPDRARFRWTLGPQEGEAPIVGFDVVVTDGEGRLRDVHGFLDRVPA